MVYEVVALSKHAVLNDPKVYVLLVLCSLLLFICQLDNAETITIKDSKQAIKQSIFRI